MMRLFRWFSVGALIVSCTEPNPRYCGDGDCSDPAYPYCDKDGVIGGMSNACIGVSCTAPDAFVACSGDTAIACNDTADSYTLTQCLHGCNEGRGCNACSPNVAFCTEEGLQHCDSEGFLSTLETCSGGCVNEPSAHCTYLSPRYLPDVCDAPASGELTFSSSATLGTDVDAICSGGIVQQTAAPEICVVRSKRITIGVGATLKATGSRVLTIVADELLQVSGTLDVSADGSVDGPGGGAMTSGGLVNGPVGGGGAGFKTAGAPGGNSSADGGAANGGAPASNPALLAVLVAGNRNSGGGGGAVSLIACRGTVVIDGMIDAGGGGGFGGIKPLQTARAGAGGGSGGHVLLQGLKVIVTGKVFANGGAGGGGYSGSVDGNAGQDGSRSAAFGANGGIPQGAEGAGGNGGFGAAPPTVGQAPSASTATAGGGGASTGYLQTYTPPGVDPMLTPSEVSPSFETPLHTPTR